MTDFQREVQLQFPSPTKLLTPAVTTILILMVVGYTLLNYARTFTFENLVLTRSCMDSLKIWQFVTYSFVNGGCGLLANGLVILFFGSAIERQWRTVATFLLALFVVLVCGLVWLGANLLFSRDDIGVSSQSLAYGFVGTFGVLFRKQRFWVLLWTLEAQTIAWILIIIGIIIGIASPMSWIWVGGALAAYLYVKAKWYLANKEVKAPFAGVRKKGFVDLD